MLSVGKNEIKYTAEWEDVNGICYFANITLKDFWRCPALCSVKVSYRDRVPPRINLAGKSKIGNDSSAAAISASICNKYITWLDVPVNDSKWMKLLDTGTAMTQNCIAGEIMLEVGPILHIEIQVALAEFKGNKDELTVFLRTKISQKIRMISLAQEIYFALSQLIAIH